MKKRTVWATAGTALLVLAAASVGYLAGTGNPVLPSSADTQTTSVTMASWDESSPDEDASDFEIFEATAYCDFGITRSGALVRRGMVAADPNVLPLGSVIEIEAGDYSGIYTVMDTGAVVKGKILDIYVPSYEEAVQFGRQKVKVRVLRRGWHPEAGQDLPYSITVAG
ncbi:MAG: hypothetical protein Kow00109_15260 [Acidobacteriota bacterium]